MAETENNEIHVGRVKAKPRGKKMIYTASFHWNGKHTRQTLDTADRALAEQAAKLLDAELLTGSYQPRDCKPRSTTQMRLTDAVDEFIAFKKVEGKRRKTIGKYETCLALFATFCCRNGATLLKDFTLRHFDKYRAERREQVGERTVYNEYRMLKTFLGFCEDRELIAANPLGKLKIKKPKHHSVGGPSLAQVNKVLEKFTGCQQAAIAILAFTGMRAGECQHLRFDLGDVDLIGGWINVVSRPGAETKTGNSRRVPIHRRLREFLEAISENYRTWFLTNKPSCKYPDGNHLHMGRLNDRFKDVLTELGILAGKKNGGFYLHSLRSFFKSFCVTNGTPRDLVDRWQDHVGHRPTAGDSYFVPTDEDSQAAMKCVPFDQPT